MSVLFADLVGFTPLSESRDAEEVRELLSRYFDTCRRLIELYGGTVEKFIGDAVMAVWGTPVATEDDAERAVRAALDLVAAVSALGTRSASEELRARAGVLTGEAAVTVGAEGEGMVAGDLVNTASRVQSVAEPGQVSRRRVDAAGDRAGDRVRGRGLVRAQGQGGADAAVAGAAGRLRVRGTLKSQGLEAPFVGRDRELRQIKDLFHTCADEKQGAARVGDGDRRDRQVAAVVGVLQVLRRAGPARLLASGPLSRLRRGRHLLGAGGHGAQALPDRRGRASGLGAAEARATLEEHLLDPEERALRRAAAGAAARARRARGARPAGPVRRLAAVLRAARRRLPDGARVRGHAVGRREPARLRRVPARVVAEPPAVCDHARPARSCSSAARRGAPATATSPRSTSSRSRRRRWRSC